MDKLFNILLVVVTAVAIALAYLHPHVLFLTPLVTGALYLGNKWMTGFQIAAVAAHHSAVWQEAFSAHEKQVALRMEAFENEMKQVRIAQGIKTTRVQ